jgi:hypothetical protein
MESLVREVVAAHPFFVGCHWHKDRNKHSCLILFLVVQ